MNSKFAGLFLATAVFVLPASAFAGGDVIYTGVKDPYAAAVPVPAPVPLPVYDAEYYVRFDTGASWLSNGSLSEHGLGMDMPSADDIEPLEFGSVAAGRYLTPSIRAELAVDLFTRGKVRSSDFNYTTHIARDVGLASPDVYTFDVTREDSVKFEQDMGMLNFYYDFRNSSRFTPYVGAGIGVTYRQLSRTASETAACVDRSNASDPTRIGCPAGTFAAVTEGTETKKAWDLAGALMAGVAVQVTDDILWDTGYRYIWQGGGLALESDTLTGTSRIEVKDIEQHQMRTGIRININ